MVSVIIIDTVSGIIKDINRNITTGILTTTSDAFVSYVTAYDFIHQPEGCIDVDRPLWRDLRERTMEDDNPILLLYYVRK